MKKTAILLSVLIIILTISCKKEYRFYGFDVKKTITLEIPAQTQEFDIESSVELYIEKLFEDKGTSADLVEEITIEDVIIEGKDYDIIDTIALYISAEGLSKIPLADSHDAEIDNNIFDETYEAKLKVTDEKMDDYVKASSIKINSVGKLIFPAAQNETIEINLRFRVLTYVK